MAEDNLMGIDPNHLPGGIIKAIDRGTLVIFVGAGISKLCGLPTWDDMANQLIDGCCFRNISLKHRDLYRGLSDPREKISLAHAHYKKNNNELDFYTHIEKMLSNESLDYDVINTDRKFKKNNRLQLDNISNIIDFIKLSHSPVITTNADDILDKECFGDRNGMVIYNLAEFDKIFDNNAPHIVHIHGSIKSINDIRFTIKDYSTLYTNSKFQIFIKKLFAERCILFIGYGLREMELIIHIAAESNEQHHYALIPYSSQKRILCEGYAELYNILNIDQIPYNVGDGNYSRLNEIMGHWTGQLNQTKAPHDIINNLKRISETKPNSDDLNTLIYYVDKPCFNLFLKNLIDSQYAADWLIQLSDTLFLNRERLMSILKELKQDERWYELTVFSFIFDKNSTHDILKEIAVKIIENVLSILREEKSLVLNDSLQSDYVHIISLIPGRLITEEMIDYLKGVDVANKMALLHFTNEKCRFEEWPRDGMVAIFNKMLSHMESNRHDIYPSDLFVRNHLAEFARTIPRELFDYSITKIADILKNDSFIYSDVGAISTYPDDHGRPLTGSSDYYKTLIEITRETMPHLSIEEMRSFIENHYEDNDLFKRIALVMIFSTSELYGMLRTDYRKYFGPKALISELYHQISTKSNEFNDDMVEFLVDVITKSDFEEQSEDIKGYLLYPLIHRSEDAGTCSSSADNISICIENGSPYDVSKLFVVSVNPGNYFEEEKEKVNMISRMNVVELVGCLQHGNNILEHHDDGRIKSDALSIHLSAISLDELFNNFHYYMSLNSAQRRLVFSRIVDERGGCKNHIVPDHVINFLLAEIKIDDTEGSGYAALCAIDSLLHCYTDEQIERMLNGILAIYESMMPENKCWSEDNVLDYYEKCSFTIINLVGRCFKSKMIKLPKKAQLVIEKKLEDRTDWQLRSAIYHRHWYRTYDMIEFSERKNIFIRKLIDIDQSIELPCVFELICAGCTEPEVIRWLFNSDLITSILNDNNVEDSIKREIGYNFGEILAYFVHDANIFSSECYKKMIAHSLPLINGYMLSGYFELLNRCELTEYSIECTNLILQHVCRLDDPIIIFGSLNQRELCKYFIKNEITTDGWKAITYSLNNRVCIISEELFGVLEKYSSTFDTNVLDVLIKITSRFIYINQDERDRLKRIIKRYENKDLDKKINEIWNNLAEKGYFDD